MTVVHESLEVPSRPKSARQKRGQGRNRQDDLTNYWKKQLPDTRFDGYQFRGTLIRREKQGAMRLLSLENVLTGISWQDDSPVEKATVQLQNPRTDQPLPVKAGHEIKIDWALADKSRWRNLCRLRVQSVGETASAGSFEAQLVDELEWFATTKEDWSFKKGEKNRPRSGKRTKGWRADQVAREVCRRMGISVGKLAKGKHYIDNLTMEGTSPMAIITKAYKLDRDETGRRFVIAMRNGRLTVTQLRRSRDLLLVGEHLIEATLQESLKKNFATVVKLHATAKKAKGKKGKKKKDKIEVEVRSSKAAVARYGRVRAEWTLDDPVASEAAARRQAKVRLAKAQEPKQELTMTLPGIPTLKRGDALKVAIPEFDMVELIYVASVSHNVAPNGDYTMEVTAAFDDPFVDKKGEEIREKICEKARKRGRKVPDYCEGGFDQFAPPPRSSQARNRRDRPQGQDGRKARR